MSKLASWSSAAPENNSPAPHGAPENTLYLPDVNNCMREMMASVKGTFWEYINGVATSTGSNNDYILNYDYEVDTVTAGQVFTWIANHTNTSSAPNLTIGTDTPKSIRRYDNSVLVAGDITSGNIIITVYDGTNFRMLSPSDNLDQINITGASSVPTGSTLSVAGGLTIAAGGTLDASAGTLTLADNQISGDKISGGTMDNTTLVSGTITSLATPLSVANGGTGGTTAYDAFANVIPPGVMVTFSGGVAPTGWLLCQGQAISRATFASLFATIGVTYGAGDGSTTFNLPDARGRALIGSGLGTGLVNNYGLGQYYGVENMALSEANLAPHSHTTVVGGMSQSHYHTGATDAQGLHAHNLPMTTSSVGGGGGGNEIHSGGGLTTDAQGVHAHNFTTGWASHDHTHGVTVNSTGSGAGFNIVQPILAVSYIIKY